MFVRERLNGYYGVTAFAVSNTLASLPFIALIAICSSASVYFIGARGANEASSLPALRPPSLSDLQLLRPCAKTYLIIVQSSLDHQQNTAQPTSTARTSPASSTSSSTSSSRS